MSEILKLEPEAIWRNFHLLNQVPRPSGHLEKIQQFLLNWAKEHHIESRLDNAGNVLMYKAASPGMEDRKVVTLQGHMDMVPQKTPDSQHNFETDPIETWIDGDWVRARNTTLGADDGMAVATIMAIFEDDSLCHGPLEAFITADEETTMYGVDHMEDGLLKGDILLNLDNETHGELMVGSAGGVNLTAELEFQTVAPEAGDKAVRIVLHGLRGGHSGLEINEGRANANKNLARVVADAIANFEARLAEWKGGNMRNAIPREAEAVLTLPAENVAALKEAVETEWQRDLVDEYGVIEPNLKIEVKEEAMPTSLVPEEIQDNLVDALLACHNGVLRFIPHLPSIVETSSNLAIVEIVDGRAFFKVLVRSSARSLLLHGRHEGDDRRRLPRLATLAGKRDRDAHGTGLQRPLRRRPEGTSGACRIGVFGDFEPLPRHGRRIVRPHAPITSHAQRALLHSFGGEILAPRARNTSSHA